jgi:hypothetical protein
MAREKYICKIYNKVSRGNFCVRGREKVKVKRGGARRG